jgi:hypothetical protein
MRGVGIAYRLYRAGVITADDEVALLHGDETTNYTCFSEPLINARLTLRYLRRKRLLSAKQEHQAIPRFKALHFSQRTFPVYREILLSDFGACEGMRMFALLQEHYRDVKRQDAEHLLQSVLLARAARPKSSFFLRTGHWRHQFEELACELSPLR